MLDNLAGRPAGDRLQRARADRWAARWLLSLLLTLCSLRLVRVYQVDADTWVEF
jgi:hypothetical protein